MRSAIVRTDRYTNVAIAFHWTIAALVLFNLWLGIAHDSLPKEWKVMPVHKSIGLTVLVLTLGRIAWRLAHPAPPLATDTPAWQRGTAHLTHFALYALLLIMPLTGWMMSSGGNPPRPLSWFFLFPVPYLPVSKGAADFGHSSHVLLGWLMLALVVLHIAAALWHHVARHDGVLARMLPFLRPRAYD